LIYCREYLALNVYVALCYYKLDYYDVSQEVLAVYLQQFPDSAIAINLKACNHFRLYNGKAAEAEIKSLMASLLKDCIFILNDRVLSLVSRCYCSQHNFLNYEATETALSSPSCFA
jgi:hypothetical protein